MASSTRTVPGSAIDWRREAVLTVSPSTMPSPSAPTSTAALPVSTPTRSRSSGMPTSLAQRPHHLRQRERGPHGPLGVVLARHRRPPNGHHRIADELLHGPAVAADQRPAAVEVVREQLPDLLRVTMLAQRREAHEIGEQHRHQPPLGDGLGGGRRRGNSAAAKRGPARRAEAVSRAGSRPRSRGSFSAAAPRTGRRSDPRGPTSAPQAAHELMPPPLVSRARARSSHGSAPSFSNTAAASSRSLRPRPVRPATSSSAYSSCARAR